MTGEGVSGSILYVERWWYYFRRIVSRPGRWLTYYIKMEKPESKEHIFYTSNFLFPFFHCNDVWITPGSSVTYWEVRRIVVTSSFPWQWSQKVYSLDFQSFRTTWTGSNGPDSTSGQGVDGVGRKGTRERRGCTRTWNELTLVHTDPRLVRLFQRSVRSLLAKVIPRYPEVRVSSPILYIGPIWPCDRLWSLERNRHCHYIFLSFGCFRRR